ncbi:transketolase [bacterium]|nr:transketolase [bacterium]
MGGIDELCINTVRFLSVDAIEAARSGHPGMPLGAAPMAYLLWDRHLRFNPRDPKWFDRDRFILSAGHASAMQYALLYLFGFDLSMDDLKKFRQWQSHTPGHPEYGRTHGVEATTGPLGEGFSMAVGMALAEKHLSSRFNREGQKIIDHFTYTIVSDGDLMEGVSSEAASLAGTLELGKLIALYDSNSITIEGNTGLAFTEKVAKRFEAFNWQVQYVPDGNDLELIESAINAAQANTKQPSLIIVETHIGYGSPLQDSENVHGAPMGSEAVIETKNNLNWPLEPPFYVPPEVLQHCRKAVDRGSDLQTGWLERFREYCRLFPEEGRLLDNMIKGEFPKGWEGVIPAFFPEDGPLATRQASGKILNALAQTLTGLIGGSADLGSSNKSNINSSGDLSARHAGERNIHFGVREHAMGAIVNGIALHGGLLSYSATFLVFADFMRPAIRLAAIMNTHSIFIFSHDSIGVGEDGPTHQPVEQVMSLRIIPNLTVIRPADANETAFAWRLAISRRKPVALITTRQKIPVLDPREYPIAQGTLRGGYILVNPTKGNPELILLATGSEVHLVIAAEKILRNDGYRVRVVSLPCWEIFREQDTRYQDEVLPHGIPRLAVEAGISTGWHRFLGEPSDIISIDSFGVSAPGSVIMQKMGFTVENVVEKALKLLKG